MNVSRIDKFTNRHSCFTFSSTSSQTPDGADIPRNYNPHPRYFYNSCHRFDIADSLQTMNQKLSQPVDWVSPTISDSQKESVELPTIDILMIGAAFFNTLM